MIYKYKLNGKYYKYKLYIKLLVFGFLYGIVFFIDIRGSFKFFLFLAYILNKYLFFFIRFCM